MIMMVGAQQMLKSPVTLVFRGFVLRRFNSRKAVEGCGAIGGNCVAHCGVIDESQIVEIAVKLVIQYTFPTPGSDDVCVGVISGG
jgi:hypothetical protein